MPYDVAFRHNQALQPAALTTIGTTLHALEAAIADCRKVGKDAETDPAVILLARHLGTVAVAGELSTMQLRRQCVDAISDIRRQPVLLTLARRGVAWDEPAKREFHAAGRRALRRLADTLLLDDATYSIHSNPGGPAVSGEVILHGEELRIELTLRDCLGPDREVLFTRVDGRTDHVGGRNHWGSIRELLNPDRFAARLRDELQLSLPSMRAAA